MAPGRNLLSRGHGPKRPTRFSLPPLTESQNTLTQLNYLTPQPSRTEERPRKRQKTTSGLKFSLAQTTITQMPFARSRASSTESEVEVEDHLGYGHDTGDNMALPIGELDGMVEENISVRRAPAKKDTRVIADSEDEGDTEESAPPSSAAPNSASGAMSNLAQRDVAIKTPRRPRFNEIPSSQSPGSSPISPFMPPPISPATPSARRTTPRSGAKTPSQSPFAPIRRIQRTPIPPPAGLRKPLADITRSTKNPSPYRGKQVEETKSCTIKFEKMTPAPTAASVISPTALRVAQFRATWAEVTNNPIRGGRRTSGLNTHPPFVASSTKTSTWSTGGDENDGLEELETQFEIGEETQAALTELATSKPADAVTPNGVRPTEEMTSPSSHQSESQELEEGSQDEAAAQLLSETQAFAEHQIQSRTSRRQRENCNIQPKSGFIRPSQASTVGTSPAPTPRTSQRYQPSSPSRPMRQPLLTSSTREQIVDISSQSSLIPQPEPLTSPSDERRSSPRLRSSPPSARSKQAIDTAVLLAGNGVLTATQLLPASMLNDSIPPPPTWNDSL